MQYSLLIPPFSPDFRSMSRTEAESYYNWFIQKIPERIKILELAVQSSAQSNYKNWYADQTINSLDVLGQWFMEHVDIRRMNEEEQYKFYKNAQNWFKEFDTEDWTLTTESISLAIDVGMYLSQVFLKNISGLKWEISTRKNDIDYQQPVLGGFGKIKFNPTNVALTQAYSCARKTFTPGNLRKLYDNWAKHILSN